MSSADSTSGGLSDRITELQRAQALHQVGVISDQELLQASGVVVGSIPPRTAVPLRGGPEGGVAIGPDMVFNRESSRWEGRNGSNPEELLAVRRRLINEALTIRSVDVSSVPRPGRIHDWSTEELREFVDQNRHRLPASPPEPPVAPVVNQRGFDL